MRCSFPFPFFMDGWQPHRDEHTFMYGTTDSITHPMRPFVPKRAQSECRHDGRISCLLARITAQMVVLTHHANGRQCKVHPRNSGWTHPITCTNRCQRRAPYISYRCSLGGLVLQLAIVGLISIGRHFQCFVSYTEKSVTVNITECGGHYVVNTVGSWHLLGISTKVERNNQ